MSIKLYLNILYTHTLVQYRLKQTLLMYWQLLKRVYIYINCIYVRVLLCVSCVPVSCVHIWFASCPCFMSLLVKYVPAVFVSLCVNYPVYISPVFWVWFGLVYSLLPRCILSMPCPALSCLDVSIKYYYLSLRPRVPVPPSCVHRDNIYIYTHTHIYIYIYIHIHTHTHVHTVYTYIHTYIYTYTHISI